MSIKEIQKFTAWTWSLFENATWESWFLTMKSWLIFLKRIWNFTPNTGGCWIQAFVHFNFKTITSHSPGSKVHQHSTTSKQQSMSSTYPRGVLYELKKYSYCILWSFFRKKMRSWLEGLITNLTLFLHSTWSHHKIQKHSQIFSSSVLLYSCLISFEFLKKKRDC